MKIIVMTLPFSSLTSMPISVNPSVLMDCFSSPFRCFPNTTVEQHPVCTMRQCECLQHGPGDQQFQNSRSEHPKQHVNLASNPPSQSRRKKIQNFVFKSFSANRCLSACLPT